MTATFAIPGPSGPLEAAWSSPAGALAGVGRTAVLCHPHPLYGGSMHDTVLDCIAGVLLDHGIEVLRFNFRGVGRSAGRHSGTGGEVDDLTAVAAFACAERPGCTLVLGGYSFGAAVVWQALERLTPERALLVAPPIGRLAFDGGPHAVPVDVFAGTQDAFIDARALSAWTGVRVHPIEGADHFFSGRLPALAAAFAAALAAAPAAALERESSPEPGDRAG